MRRWKQALILLLLLTVYTLAEVALVRATSDELEQDLHRLVNERRASQELKPLTFNPEISSIADATVRTWGQGRSELAMLEPKAASMRLPEL